MISEKFQELVGKDGVVLRPGLDDAALAALEEMSGIRLPDDHREFLRFTNGAEGYGGHIRMFGFGPDAAIDMISWNSPGHWKFAWDGRADGFFCFGETARGDQYAYNIEELKAGNASVYILDANGMWGDVFDASFAEHFVNEFLRFCDLPYEARVVAARAAVGDLLPSEHIVYNPSVLIGGAENVENIQKMPARIAMIVQGDMAIGVDALPDDVTSFQVDVYQDEEDRLRLKIVAVDEAPTPVWQ